MRRLAALMQYTEDDGQGKRWLAALRDDLQKLGWIEGRNLHIDYRWGGTDMNLLQRLAKEIVAAKPDVILSSSSSPTRILKQETGTIPIIFGNIVDPVGQGLVVSMSRPGANITGFVIWNPPSPGNTSSCSRRSRHALAAPRSSTIRRRRPITKST
jgi:putative tryptophan/tyrosine transport system substrate-binding protein